jgi:hypothetical protein
MSTCTVASLVIPHCWMGIWSIKNPVVEFVVNDCACGGIFRWSQMAFFSEAIDIPSHKSRVVEEP